MTTCPAHHRPGAPEPAPPRGVFHHVFTSGGDSPPERHQPGIP